MSINADNEHADNNQAKNQECWIQAMNYELLALQQNETWIFVDPPKHVKTIGNMWVYKIKHKAYGTIERHKARLVVKGYNQVKGIDFFYSLSHIAKITIVRTLLAVEAIKSWHLHQLYVNNAFLHGDLQEEIYMKVPHDFQIPKPNQVCKLIKSLYGLNKLAKSGMRS